MKKSLLLLTCVLALALGATAQNQINFAQLPLVSTPAPLPNGYYGFNWSDFFYVDPERWSEAGPGYMLSPVINRDVAFVGDTGCTWRLPALHHTCNGTITANGPISFQAVSATVAGGFGTTSITVLAYNNGNYVGASFYSLGTELQTITFPPSWGPITQLTFQTPAGGDLVFYDLQAYLIL